jgi:3-hydroxybutyryl-CoA dehydrogenase
MNINILCVCGAGTMGRAIAQTIVQSGFNVLLFDLDKTILEKAKVDIEINLQALVDKGKLALAEKEKIFGKIIFTNDIQQCRADIFIEAIIENIDAKVSLFNRLEDLNGKTSIFASNTSSLSVTAIAAKIKNPGNVIGMHFFNPATVMKLVEIVNTHYTYENTTRIILELTRQIGKTPVLCKDSPGFIVNRVARPYYIEALRLAEENDTDFDQLDTLLEATGFKMGPFKLMDLIGNDINYAVSQSVYEQLDKPERLKPSFIQEQKVKEGKLGKKSGEGYYKYNLSP